MSLEIKDQRIGTGEEAKPGRVVGVLYKGTLKNGSEFDSSGSTPFRVPLGEGAVIEGWEKGLIGMKVGGQRRLVIPPEMAYGDEGFPPVIPANATLIFDIELVEVSASD